MLTSLKMKKEYEQYNLHLQHDIKVILFWEVSLIVVAYIVIFHLRSNLFAAFIVTDLPSWTKFIRSLHSYQSSTLTKFIWSFHSYQSSTLTKFIQNLYSYRWSCVVEVVRSILHINHNLIHYDMTQHIEIGR